MPVHELIRIPVWQGNRIIDLGHVAEIAAGVGGDLTRLDFGYRIVQYDEVDAAGNRIKQSYLIDGQHRARILRDTALLPDFLCIVIEKSVGSELEAIAYFNTLNNVKPMHWSDTNLVISKYIAEIECAFNTRKTQLIRKGRSVRPYLSVDRLREVLLAAKEVLSEDVDRIKGFATRAVEWNSAAVRHAELTLGLGEGGKHAEMLEKCSKMGFMLACDPRLPWVSELLGVGAKGKRGS